MHIYRKTTRLAANSLDDICCKDNKYLPFENEKFTIKLRGIIIMDYSASEEIVSCISLFCSVNKKFWGHCPLFGLKNRFGEHNHLFYID